MNRSPQIGEFAGLLGLQRSHGWPDPIFSLVFLFCDFSDYRDWIAPAAAGGHVITHLVDFLHFYIEGYAPSGSSGVAGPPVHLLVSPMAFPLRGFGWELDDYPGACRLLGFCCTDRVIALPDRVIALPDR